MHEAISELNRIRLEDNLSYAQLAAASGMSEPTLRRILQAADPQCYDRTIYRIEKFLLQYRRRARRRA